jgi:hypothetical protein
MMTTMIGGAEYSANDQGVRHLGSRLVMYNLSVMLAGLSPSLPPGETHASRRSARSPPRLPSPGW